MTVKIYKITNYGNTRKLPYKGMYYELTKNTTIEVEDKALADALGGFEFVDVEVIERTVKVHKKKLVFKKKKKATPLKKNKKIKLRKFKRRLK